MNSQAHVHSSDGKPFKQADKATYLGGEINNGAGRWIELDNRIDIAFKACDKLKTFWYKTDCSYIWKLQVYDAVIIAQLTHGLNTVQLTVAILSKMDAGEQVK